MLAKSGAWIYFVSGTCVSGDDSFGSNVLTGNGQSWIPDNYALYFTGYDRWVFAYTQ